VERSEKEMLFCKQWIISTAPSFVKEWAQSIHHCPDIETCTHTHTHTHTHIPI
jgi:hypothetical protein